MAEATASSSDSVLGPNFPDALPVADSWRAYFEGSQLFKDALEQSLRSRHEMSLSDYNILLVLYEARELLCMSEVAQKVVFQPSRLTYAIQSLKKRGYVEQMPAPEDRRLQLVYLTAKGLEAFGQARHTHRADVNNLFLKHLSEEDVLAICRVFGDLKARLSV